MTCALLTSRIDSGSDGGEDNIERACCTRNGCFEKSGRRACRLVMRYRRREQGGRLKLSTATET